MRRFVPAGALAIVTALAVTACSHEAGAPADETVAADTTQLVPVTPGELAQVVRSGGARVTLVNVWASWCQPCREEFPDLVRLQRAYADRRFRLVLVSADFTEDLPAARAYLAQQGVNWRTFHKIGDDMQFIDSLDARWSGALPGSFLYDRDGRLIRFWEGKANYATLEERLLSVLEAPTKPDSVEERS